MDRCELQVLIATFGEEGLQRLAKMALPCESGVRYLVSCQSPGNDSPPLPASLQREDMEVIFTRTKGLAINRNNALRHATGPLCLISDDDVEFTPESFRNIISTFKKNPDVDVAAFEYRGPEGRLPKPYPQYSFPLDKPAKGYYVSSIEIAFRLESVRATGVLFNEKFGVGTSCFGSGEDELWVYDLLQAGLKGRFFPTVIALHRHSETTGLRNMANPAVLRAQGAVIKRLYPRTALLRIMLKARRSSKATHTPFLSCLPPLLYGWWQATVHPGRLFGNK